MWNRRWWGIGKAGLGLILVGAGLLLIKRQWSADVCEAFDAGRLAEREAGGDEDDG